jgi:hypothetical protein
MCQPVRPQRSEDDGHSAQNIHCCDPRRCRHEATPRTQAIGRTALCGETAIDLCHHFARGLYYSIATCARGWRSVQQMMQEPKPGKVIAASLQITRTPLRTLGTIVAFNTLCLYIAMLIWQSRHCDNHSHLILEVPRRTCSKLHTWRHNSQALAEVAANLVAQQSSS